MKLAILMPPTSVIDPQFCGGGHRIALELGGELLRHGWEPIVVGRFTHAGDEPLLVGLDVEDENSQSYVRSLCRASDLVLAMNYVPDIAWPTPTLVYFCHYRTSSEWQYEVGSVPVDGFVFHSYWLEACFQSTFPGVRSCAVRGAVHDWWFKDHTRHNREPQVRVTFAGALLREKGLEDLLDAWKIAEAPDTELVVAGDSTLWGNDVGTALRLCELKRPGLSLLGAVPYSHMRDLWMSTDIMVMPSRYRECLPLTLVEAIAAGCRVVYSDVDGNREVAQNGRFGTAFEPGNVEDLAEVLRIQIDLARVQSCGSDPEALHELAREHSWSSAAESLMRSVDEWL